MDWATVEVGTGGFHPHGARSTTRPTRSADPDDALEGETMSLQERIHFEFAKAGSASRARTRFELVKPEAGWTLDRRRS